MGEVNVVYVFYLCDPHSLTQMAVNVDLFCPLPPRYKVLYLI